MTVINAVLPVISVLLGAGITYALNVRSRQRTHVEECFNEAIGSMAVVISSMSYVPHYGKWHPDVTEDERIAMEKEVAREATLNHMRAISVARDALARCVPYRPELLRYLDEPVLSVQDNAVQIIEELRRSQR